MQLVDALALFLVDSPFYPVISQLPLPDSTNPTTTTTLVAQTAVHNSLPLIEEIVAILEKDEKDAFDKEVERRRTRLINPGADQIKREVGVEVWSVSKVSCPSLAVGDQH